jgi:hypothetical protein
MSSVPLSCVPVSPKAFLPISSIPIRLPALIVFRNFDEDGKTKRGKRVKVIFEEDETGNINSILHNKNMINLFMPVN